MSGKMVAATPFGPVALRVPDLARSIGFYEQVIGLTVRSRFGAQAILGSEENDLLVLEEDRHAVSPGRSTGLYHFAILLPSRLALARQLEHFIHSGVRLQGTADHLVSEAIYLADPDGNGIEIYRDWPREQWTYRDGHLRMSTDPLDVDGLMSELEQPNKPWQCVPPATAMVYVHLKVSDLGAAEAFYREVLGMDLTLRLGESAAFLSYPSER